MLPPLEDDPRFPAALRHFDDGDWLEAADLFEEIYFESVRDEIPVVRFLLQISTGLHHVSRGQQRAAAERLREGLRILPEVVQTFGVDLARIEEIARERLRTLPE